MIDKVVVVIAVVVVVVAIVVAAVVHEELNISSELLAYTQGSSVQLNFT